MSNHAGGNKNWHTSDESKFTLSPNATLFIKLICCLSYLEVTLGDYNQHKIFVAVNK